MLFLEVKNQLLQLLLEKETISDSDFDKILTARDFSKINLIHDKGPEFKRGLILSALQELQVMGFVAEVKMDKKNSLWILTNPIELFRQTIEIPGAEAVYISGILNQIRELAGVKGSVDATKLTLEDFLFAFDYLAG